MKVQIELMDVWKTYKMSEKVRVDALRGISLRIRKGEMLAIVGPSGSGKSTLMHVMGCLDRPTKGRVILNGRDVSRLTDDELAEIRRERIGFVFQAYNLINTLTALENVAMPMIFAGVEKEERTERAKRLLEEVNMLKRANHRPREMSGGEQQRVAIARALANDPEIILADEPTGNLDSKTGRQVIDLFRKLNEEKNKTVVIVTHDLAWTDVVDKTIKIMDGKVVEVVE